MMGLHSLVLFREQLTSNAVTNAVSDKVNELIHKVSAIKDHMELTEEQVTVINDLIKKCDDIMSSVKSMDSTIDVHVNNLNQQINRVTHDLFANSYKLEDRYNENAEYVRNNWRIVINSDVEYILHQRMYLYIDWKYPALEIGCRDGEFTKHLIAADPLYLVDRNREFLSTASEQFPVAYQRRLRTYHLVNHDLSMLPQGQFAFIFSWGYFNYVSMDTMKMYLKQAYDLLRPGGVFMFSYNDGDSPGGAGMAEQMARAYTPKSVLLAVCEGLGFEVVHIADHGPAISWLEIKKPGELSTVKAHQVLGEIKHREN